MWSAFLFLSQCLVGLFLLWQKCQVLSILEDLRSPFACHSTQPSLVAFSFLGEPSEAQGVCLHACVCVCACAQRCGSESEVHSHRGARAWTLVLSSVAGAWVPAPSVPPVGSGPKRQLTKMLGTALCSYETASMWKCSADQNTFLLLFLSKLHMYFFVLCLDLKKHTFYVKVYRKVLALVQRSRGPACRPPRRLCVSTCDN